MAIPRRHSLTVIALWLPACIFDPPPIIDGASESSEDSSTSSSPTASSSGLAGDEATSGSSTGPAPSSCSNGIVEGGEECDDANLVNGDGCSSQCEIEGGFGCIGEPSTCQASCGDGRVVGSEACDDANPVQGDGCSLCSVDPGFHCESEPSTCSVASCGDGTVTIPETCDDGNVEDDDGCAANCTIEMYSRCVGESPSSCAPIRILLAPADDDSPSFRTALLGVTQGLVDFLPATNETPASAMLAAQFDCVITYANLDFQDPIAFGTALAEFVDAGGTVVLGLAAGHPSLGLLDSPIFAAGYSPVVVVDIANPPEPVGYAGDGATVLHHAIEAYDATVLDSGVALQGSGLQESTFTDGTIATAYRPDFHVVYVNGTGNSLVPAGGDWVRLFANACAAGHLQ